MRDGERCERCGTVKGDTWRFRSRQAATFYLLSFLAGAGLVVLLLIVFLPLRGIL